MSWNLPPGCTDRDIAEACPGYWDEYPQRPDPWDECFRCGNLEHALKEATLTDYCTGEIRDVQICPSCAEEVAPSLEWRVRR